MLKVAKERTFTHDVTARVPADGGYKDETFKVTFVVVDVYKAGEFALASAEGTTDFLKTIIKKIDDVEDEAGKAIPYSDELRDQVIALPWARNLLVSHYFDAVSGEARLGN